MTYNEFKALSKKAQSGDVRSMFQLGLIYIQGCGGVEKYPEEAFYWLSKVVKEFPSYYSGSIRYLVYG